MGGLGASLRAPDWKSESMITFQKDFYSEDPEITSMTNSQVDAFRREKEINCVGPDIPRPVMRFYQMKFPSYVMSEINVF